MVNPKSLQNLKNFTSERQPVKRGRHKGRSVTDWLRVLSHTEIDFQNPLTGLKDRATVNQVIAIQLILKSTQDSDLPSIKEYIDRLEGKIPQRLIGEGIASETKIIIVRENGTQDKSSEGRLSGQVSVQQS